MEKVVKKGIWTKNFLILFVVNVSVSLGFQMLNPNMAGFSESLGIGVGAVGVIVAAFGFAALVSRPFSGRAADRFDNKKLVLMSLGGLVVTTFLYTVANSFTLLMIIRFAHGLCFGLNSTLIMTMASHTLPEERMGSGMAIFGVGMTLSLLLAPSFGIFAADNFGYKVLFYTASTLMAVAVLLILLVDNTFKREGEGDAEESDQPFWMTFFAPEALSPSVMSMLTACAYSSINSFVVLYGRERGVGSLLIYFTVNAVALLVTRPLFSKLLDTVPVKRILYPCFGLLVVSMIVLWQAKTLPVFLLSSVCYGIGNGGSMPALQSLALRCVGADRRGAASGTYYMGLDVGNVVGPILAGALIGAAGYANMYLIMAIPVGLSVVVLFFSRKLPEKA